MFPFVSHLLAVLAGCCFWITCAGYPDALICLSAYVPCVLPKLPVILMLVRPKSVAGYASASTYWIENSLRPSASMEQQATAKGMQHDVQALSSGS